MNKLPGRRAPVRIPYGRQTIDESDIRAVAETLRSEWLTQGPKVAEFERSLARRCGAKYAVAFANGTAALQGAYYAAGLGPGDEFVTSPMTFASTATAGVWQGGRPVFADVDPATGNVSPESCARVLTARTKVLVPVDYSGHPAELDRLSKLARERGLVVIEDACHALGATYKGRAIGGWSDMTVFSFHPVKSITTGEGGAVLTNDRRRWEALARFRQHGVSRGEDWEYAVEDRALNYRLTDIQCALGLSQLKRLDAFIARRRELAARYHRLLSGWDELEPNPIAPETSSWHLYVIRLRGPFGRLRREVFRGLRARGIGVQVHYIPVYWHPFYRRLGYKRGLCPAAEDFYGRILSLPIYPGLADAQQDEVVLALRETLSALKPAGRLRASSGGRAR